MFSFSCSIVSCTSIVRARYNCTPKETFKMSCYPVFGAVPYEKYGLPGFFDFFYSKRDSLSMPTTRSGGLNIQLFFFFCNVVAFAFNDLPHPGDELLHFLFGPASHRLSFEADNHLLCFLVVRELSPSRVFFDGRKHINIARRDIWIMTSIRFRLCFLYRRFRNPPGRRLSVLKVINQNRLNRVSTAYAFQVLGLFVEGKPTVLEQKLLLSPHNIFRKR